MKLNDAQFCRVVPFIAILHTFNEALGVPTETDAKQLPGRRWDNALSAAYDVIEKQGSAIATRDFPHVVFEDETERETLPLSARDVLDAADAADEMDESELPLDLLDDAPAYAFTEPTPGDEFTDNYLLA